MKPYKNELTLRKHSFYYPNALRLLSALTNTIAWVSLIIAILYLLRQFFTLDYQIMSEHIHAVVENPFTPPYSGHWWEAQNLISGLVLDKLLSFLNTAALIIGNFFLFKCISLSINVLHELGFNMTSNREKSKNE